MWHSEFGRLPISERMDGRDHNAAGFSVWLAGGGVKGGTIVGATDHYGYRAVENPKTVYDLHATILRLMGLDFEKLTYRFNGRDMRSDGRTWPPDTGSAGVTRRDLCLALAAVAGSRSASAQNQQPAAAPTPRPRHALRR